jgi:hypothetical protein
VSDDDARPRSLQGQPQDSGHETNDEPVLGALARAERPRPSGRPRHASRARRPTASTQPRCLPAPDVTQRWEQRRGRTGVAAVSPALSAPSPWRAPTRVVVPSATLTGAVPLSLIVAVHPPPVHTEAAPPRSHIGHEPKVELALLAGVWPVYSPSLPHRRQLRYGSLSGLRRCCHLWPLSRHRRVLMRPTSSSATRGVCARGSTAIKGTIRTRATPTAPAGRPLPWQRPSQWAMAPSASVPEPGIGEEYFV